MSDGSKTNDSDNTPDEPDGTSDEPESRTARLRRRLSEWQIKQHVARGLAYGVGSGAVSLLVLGVRIRYFGG